MFGGFMGVFLEARWIMLRPQFTLRALMVAITMMCVAVTGLRLPLLAHRRQRQIANELQMRGIEVGYYYYSWPVWIRWLYGEEGNLNPTDVTWHGQPPSDEEIRLLARLDLRRLSFAHTLAGDRYLCKLGALDRLEELDLRGTAITDAGLRQLPIMPTLKRVYVAKTNISQSGTSALCRRVYGWQTINVCW